MPLPDDLPRPGPRLAVRVTPDALRRIRAGHPWVFDRSIRSTNREGAPGDLAVVFDDQRRFAAIGLWDPTSPIRLRILHQGDPATIDPAWFARRIGGAMGRRSALAATDRPGGATTAYRVVNGENDGLPGLILDRYDDVGVVKLYSPAWWPHLRDVATAASGELGLASLVLRMSRAVRDLPGPTVADGQVLAGRPVDAPVRYLENGLLFEADVVHGQKTGAFLDQRDNRARVRSLAGRTRVLDVFCSAGGFTVHAAAGGASAALAVDVSPHAVESVRRHVAMNDLVPAVRACDVEARCADAFEELERLRASRRRFDLVVVDPPSFAPNAAAVPRALAAYERLTTAAVALVETGGVLVQASCSSRVATPDFFRTVHAAAGRAGVELAEIERTGHATDHPVTFPEGEYLKAIVARVERPSARARHRP